MRALIRILFFVALCLASVGCATKPTGTHVERIRFEGLPADTEPEIRGGISTREPEKTFWLFTSEYHEFDPEALVTDQLRVERQLRRRGYYDARVTATRIVRLDEDAVRIEIEVLPGEPVRIERVNFEGLSGEELAKSDSGIELGKRAFRAVRLTEGELFDEDSFDAAKQALADTLADAGYAYAEVNGHASVDVARRHAELTFEVTLGRKAKFGKISIVGLQELPEYKLLEIIDIRSGDTFSRSEVASARAALYDLGVFAAVTPEVDTRDPTKESVDVVIRVEESPLRSISAGVGARLDVQRLALTGRVGWTHKNFAGGLRTLSVTSRPALTFFPTRLDNFIEPVNILPENSLALRLEQPAFLEARTRGFAEVGFNVYPLLYPLPTGITSEEAKRAKVIGYLELPSAVGLTRSFYNDDLNIRFPVTLAYHYRFNHPFVYQPSTDPDPGIKDLIVTYPELTLAIDGRDDPVATTKGAMVSIGFQTALPILGSDVYDYRIRPEFRGFWPVTRSRNLVVATRFTLGFLFPQTYGDSLGSSNPAAEDQHRLLFRAFYSGGPDSNRGYPYQRIGPQGPIQFLVPEIDCSVEPLPADCALPLGGLSLWEGSFELRYKFFDPWSLVLFADASNVSINRLDFNFRTPHVSIGPGIRYASPVGPIRVDLGYRVPGLQRVQPALANEPPDIADVEPYSTPGHTPLNLSILIGEAF